MKFSIRDLLLLTLVVALGAAWWVDRRQLERAALDSRHAQAVAERHHDEYRRAYIELHRAVERAGLSITSAGGQTHVVDPKQAAATAPSAVSASAKPGGVE
ncbi:MAG TPA: hypothetical protein VFB80_16005 [Pirellulaceae bacterium]|nr:hypothetical protein [Pirellulaceae bacterium]